jgi:hypothetical protein
MEPQVQQQEQQEEVGGERGQVGLLLGLRLVCCDSVGVLWWESIGAAPGRVPLNGRTGP